MITVKVNTRNAILIENELITSGSVGIAVHFDLSDDWAGLSKTAVFSDGTTTKFVILTSDECVIPHECMTTAGKLLTIGIYGTNGDSLVVPTIYCRIGRVRTGAEISGDPSVPPTPSVVEQILVAATNAEALARSVRDDADAGKFDGAPGPPGPPGEDGAREWSQLSEKPFETIGENLKVVNGVLSVDTAEVVEEDNTKPITSAAVYTEVGNIAALLAAI